MDRYLKLSQYLAEGDTAKANELFHTLVADTARGLYEAMESEEDLDDDSIGGDAADDLIADVSAPEDGRNMEEAEEPAKKEKSSQQKSNVVPNAAKLVPAPKPVNTQAKDVNNLTPFPKVN